MRSLKFIRSLSVNRAICLKIFLQVTFSMECLWLFNANIRTKIDDDEDWNRNCDGGRFFSTSRNAALIESKMLQYTTLSMKLHHCTLSEIKTQVVTLSDVLACVSIHCADQKQHSSPDFLTKSVIITLQTWVDISYDYLQAYNIGANVKNHLFL